MFVKLGYPRHVAGTLARLCVNRTPAGAFIDRAIPWADRQPLRSPHLPQGSPCSPALANLCAFRLDIRLHALAESMGAVYSRYADDMVFSGDATLERAMDRFHVQVAAIALEEGFRVNTRKTRMMRAGTRQQVTGIVVNRHPNVSRQEFDTLKATLSNCVRHGPASQNRDGRPDYQAYLRGKVAYVAMVNPARGQRLKRLMDKVRWEPQAPAP
jgi:retron-type reverse transcriptase